MKKCSRCKQEKYKSEFNKDSSRKDGLQYWCKLCYRQYTKNQKEKISKRKAQYYIDHKEEIKIKSIKYRQENKEKVKTQRAQYYKGNRKERLKKQKQYYQDHKEEVAIYGAKYYQKHRKKKIAYQTQYIKHRKATDVQFRLRCSLRDRFRKALKKSYKNGSAIRDLGCSIEEFKLYIENQFEPGMTWDNWGRGKGKWNLDHVIPLANYDLTNRMELLEACNWLNYQPLWGTENLKKGAK